jgi:hypothetical protein
MNAPSSGPADRPWGIAVHMPSGDPMSAPHLLGEDWASARWYATQADRDLAFVDMQDHPPWYRRGDSPSVHLEKINPPD